MHFLPVDVTWECLINDFSFFSVESCLFIFFVRKKLSSQIGSFHWLLALATECFFSFDIFEIHSDRFLGF